MAALSALIKQVDGKTMVTQADVTATLQTLKTQLTGFADQTKNARSDTAKVEAMRAYKGTSHAISFLNALADTAVPVQ